MVSGGKRPRQPRTQPSPRQRRPHYQGGYTPVYGTLTNQHGAGHPQINACVQAGFRDAPAQQRYMARSCSKHDADSIVRDMLPFLADALSWRGKLLGLKTGTIPEILKRCERKIRSLHASLTGEDG